MSRCHWAVLALVLFWTSRGITQDSAGVRTPVTALATAPGDLLLVGSASGLLVYNMHAVEPEPSGLRIKTRLTEIQAITFSPDGRLLAVAGGTPAEAGILELFDWSSSPKKEPVLLQRVESHSDVITDVAWSSSGKRLVTCSLDATWQVFELTGGSPDALRVNTVSKIEGHSRGVTSVNFLSGDLIATASLDSTIRLWDVSTGKLVRTLSNHRAEVLSTSVRPSVKDEA